MCEQCLTNPAIPIIRMDDNVVGIEQRFGGEGGEAKEAVDQAHGMAVDEGERAVEMGNLAQAFDQGFLRVFGQSGAAAHGIAGVMVEQGQQTGGMVWVVEVGGDDGEIHAGGIFQR